MTTLYLDASLYPSHRALHEALRAMLSLPDYYGLNADALYDCLSERQEKVRLWIASPGTGETARALEVVRSVVEDLGGEVRDL